jgi:lactate permease
VSLLVAVAVYSMPVGQALLAGTEGAAFGFFPIMWIVHQRDLGLQHDGRHRALRRAAALVRQVSDDQRIQAIIIAFCFGALLEALAGFGTRWPSPA